MIQVNFYNVLYEIVKGHIIAVVIAIKDKEIENYNHAKNKDSIIQNKENYKEILFLQHL